MLLLMLVCAFGFAAQAQGEDELLFPIWDERGKEGYVDAQGDTVITPQFDQVTRFSEGMAAVRFGEKWGYIDRNGKLVVAPRWKEVHPFKDGVAAVVDKQAGYAYTPLPEEGDGFEIGVLACGYIDKTGRYVIAPSVERKLTVCPDFAEGLAPVNFDALLKFFFPDFADAGKGGYMDKTGQWAIKPQFIVAYPFAEGLALVITRQYEESSTRVALADFAYLDKSGRIVFELKGYSDAGSFDDGLAQAMRRPGKIAFIDRAGRVQFEVNAMEVGTFNSGLARARNPATYLYGFIDRKGRWAIPATYTDAMPFSDGLASVCTSPSRCFYINTRNVLVFEHGGESYFGGLSLQHLYTRTIGPRPDFRNIYGYRNKEGKYVWVSPGGETVLGKKWWRENYTGTHMPTTFSKP
ncbi:MAG TPA: WG repeat-containing protein [Pyrinomonadaceae bacterium]